MKAWKIISTVFILYFVLIGSFYLSNFVLPPTHSEVLSFLSENGCDPSYVETDFDTEHYCAYYLRRHTSVFFGNVINVPYASGLFVTTPFMYLTYFDLDGDDDHGYVYVDTRDKGKQAYNPINGEHVGTYEDFYQSLEDRREMLEKAIERINAESTEKQTPKQTTPKNSICYSNVYNCVNFSSQREAQETFEFCGGLGNDVHHLDGDEDNIACEALR